jgi:hypothetical protein
MLKLIPPFHGGKVFFKKQNKTKIKNYEKENDSPFFGG